MSNATALGYPLSYVQARAWKAGPQWAVATLRLSGPLDKERLVNSLSAMVARHEILRTRFEVPAGMRLPYQVIDDPQPVQLQTLAEVNDPESRFETWLTTTADELKPSYALATLDADNHMLFMRFPATCADDGALGIFARELACFYEGNPPEEEPLQYPDVANWLDSLMEDEDANAAVAHWSTPQFKLQHSFALPEARQSQSSPQSAIFRQVLPPATFNRIQILSNTHAVPLAEGLFILWQTLLRKRLATDDLVIGKLHDGRDADELASVLGPLSRYLPKHAHFSRHTRFNDLATHAKQSEESSQEWAEYFRFQHIQGNHAIQYFPILFSYKEKIAAFERAGLRWSMERCETINEASHLHLSITQSPSEWVMQIIYDQQRYAPATVERLASQFVTLADQITGERPLDSFSILGDQESADLLESLSAQGPPSAQVQTVAAAIAQQPKTALAIVYRDQGNLVSLTYGDLLTTAEQIAQFLKSQGIKTEDRVGLMAERNHLTIAALIAILRLGATYVPLDPALPKTRLAFMQQDASLALILGSKSIQDHLTELPCPHHSLAHACEQGTRSPRITAQQPVFIDQLAYVIYTSGSTGQPKGVAVSHRALMSYATGLVKRLNLSKQAQMASPATMAADLGNTALFGALCTGRTYRILDDEAVLDAETLAQDLAEQPVECLKIVPSHFQALLAVDQPERLLPRECLIFGGDILLPTTVARIRELSPKVRLINHYGPTEATVGVLTHEADAAAGQTQHAIPIGYPLPGATVRVMDPTAALQPTGLRGELHIGGATLARCYWQDPRKTAACFVPDPYAKTLGQRLYCSGDMARVSAMDGIHFLGRLDHQIKIKGYRVEIPEIEHALRALPTIDQAAVKVNDQLGSPRIVAYVVAKKPLGIEELRDQLEDRLPEYMLPQLCLCLDQLPLNPNGKIDRNALPTPDEDQRRSTYSAPTNPTEQALTDVWSHVLGVDKVGIDENFFALGGDSIMTIQVVARARSKGIHFKPKLLFDQPTIRKLAALTSAVEVNQDEQGTVTGEAPLTPIQARFFEMTTMDRHHFNLSIMLAIDPELKDAHIEQAVLALVQHHDALRTRFPQRGASHYQKVVATITVPYERHSFRSTDDISALATHIQSSLNIETGPALKVARFAGGNTSDYLLLAVHHLLVDGVSWRVLLEDLETSMGQLRADKPVQLPPKTTSFLLWSRKLHSYARTHIPAAEQQYWLEQSQGDIPKLPRDNPSDDPGQIAEVDISLAVHETEALLQQLPAIFNTEINDALLTAIAWAIQQWCGHRTILVELESHGRAALFEDADTTRTVGWFTNRYPVRLTIPRGTPSDLLLAVKEQLRAIPNAGMGYGLLRYLSESETIKSKLANFQPEINVNYLGNLDRVLQSTGPFQPTTVDAGAMASPRHARNHELNIQGRIQDKRLHLTIYYGQNSFHQKTMQRFAQGIQSVLLALIQSAEQSMARQWSPSDFSYPNLSQDALDLVMAAQKPAPEKIEDIVPLTPMQWGMLYHSMESPGSGVYVVQLSCDLVGQLDVPAFQRAWQRIAARFDVLRTSFLGLDTAQPMQIIQREVALPWHIEDWREGARTDQIHDLNRLRLETKHKGFDPSRAPLMNLFLIRTAADRHRFMCTYHHALMDGWSVPIVLRCLGWFYREEVKGTSPPALPPAPPYRDYVTWLQNRDQQEAKIYWRNDLAGFDALMQFPMDHGTPAKDSSPTAVHDRLQVTDEQHTRALQQLVRSECLTMNAVAQSIWALLLGLMANRRDVLFGCVLSGRPSELPHVEHMVGTFLNTIPVRYRFEEGQQVIELMRQQMREQAYRESHGHVPLIEITRQSTLREGRLFETLYQYQNYPMGKALTETDTAIGLDNLDHHDENNFLFTMIVSCRALFASQFMWSKDRINNRDATLLQTTFHIMVATFVENPTILVKELFETVQLPTRWQQITQSNPSAKRSDTIEEHALTTSQQDDPLARARAYWLANLQSASWHWRLPSDRAEADRAVAVEASHQFTIKTDAGTISPELAIAAFTLLLHGLSKRNDLLFGIYTGHLSLPLRISVESDHKLSQLIDNAAQVYTKARTHSDLPLARILDLVATKTTTHPPFPVALHLGQESTEAPWSISAQTTRTPQFPNLGFYFVLADTTATVIYNEAQFIPATIQRLGQRFSGIIAFLQQTPDVPVVDVLQELIRQERRARKSNRGKSKKPRFNAT